MGYFTNLYVAELSAGEGGITCRTTVFGSDVGRHAYFSFGEGQRPPGLFSYAGGAIESDAKLTLLRAYPLTEVLTDDPDSCLFESSFNPRGDRDAVVLHVVLPENFIPRRDLQPFIQPTPPLVSIVQNRIRATYPTQGASTLRFHIRRLESPRTLDTFDLSKVFDPDQTVGSSVGVEFNLGIVKFKFGR